MSHHQLLQNMLNTGREYYQNACKPFVNQAQALEIPKLDSYLEIQQKAAKRYDLLLQLATELAVQFKVPLFKMSPLHRAFALDVLRSNVVNLEQWENEFTEYAKVQVSEFARDSKQQERMEYVDDGVTQDWPVDNFKVMLENMKQSYLQMKACAAEQTHTEENIRKGAFALRQFDYYFTHLKLLLLQRVASTHQSTALVEKVHWIQRELETIIPTDGQSIFISMNDAQLDRLYQNLPNQTPGTNIFSQVKATENKNSWWSLPTFKGLQSSWLLSFLGDKKLRLGAFFCMVVGAGFSCRSGCGD